MFDKIIVPVDGSTFGELAAHEEERLSLARTRAQEYMAELQKRVILSGCDVPISSHVEVGSVVEGLDSHAREARADLLVMTTHGWGPLRRAWLGSVADGLLRRTPCPILAIRPGEGEELKLEETRFQHLLVTLDGSPESREILPFARALAQVSGCSVTLLRVIPPHFPLSSPFTSHTSHQFQGLERLILGSVADKIIRGGNIPVLLHRAP